MDIYEDYEITLTYQNAVSSHKTYGEKCSHVSPEADQEGQRGCHLHQQ